jgi:hypothetical protein
LNLGLCLSATNLEVSIHVGIVFARICIQLHLSAKKNAKPEKESLESIPRSFRGDLKQFSVIILVKLLIADRSAQMHIKLAMTDNRGDSINHSDAGTKQKLDTEAGLCFAR